MICAPLAQAITSDRSQTRPKEQVEALSQANIEFRTSLSQYTLTIQARTASTCQDVRAPPTI